MTHVSLPVMEDGRRAATPRHRMERDLRALTTGIVRCDAHTRMLYATDASIYQVEPLAVVEPRTIEEAHAIVSYCGENGLPLLPRGGGTSLAGQAVSRAVVLDFSRFCNRLLEFDAHRHTVRVEPGIVLSALNQQLQRHNLMFGPDVATASHANLGGMIGNNSAGAHSVLYGRTVEHLEALDVALWDGTRLRLEAGAAANDEHVAALTQQVADLVLPLAGEIERCYPKIRRHVDGYNLDLMLQQLRASTPGTFDRVNLAHLFCGSEGTLGVTLEARLSLVSTPQRRSLGIIAFPDIDAALEAVNDILRTEPAAVELIDDMLLDLAWRNTECRRYAALVPSWSEDHRGAVLYVEYYGDDEQALDERFERLGMMFSEHPRKRYDSPAEMAAAWKLRASGEPLLYGVPGRRKPITFIEDAAVAPKHLPEFIRRFRHILEKHGTHGAYYAHASVGCLHVRPLIDLRDADDRKSMQRIVEEITDLVREYGGALSGEHGDGRLRSHLLERFYGREICDGFRQIKAIFDPHNLMNPGNIVAPDGMLEHMRVRPDDCFVEAPDVDTFYRYESEQGFGHAVELCNGAGVCRKMSGGTMCPSYRATRDERHATRGRGNALRLAITGQFGMNGAPVWNDAETEETLNLCLACKGCKSECPSNVDIAKLKAEYLAQGFRARGGPPLRAKAFGRVRPALQLASRFPRLANTLAGFGPMRAIANAALGLDPRRSLPRIRRSLLRDAPRHRAELPADAPRVILFADCFVTYLEPHIGRAVVDVLEAFGYRAVVVDAGCCGRSLISVGMLEEATRTISATIHRLESARREHDAEAIIVVEPSCLSSLVDDWRDLKLAQSGSELTGLCDHAMSLEQLLHARWDEHSRQPALERSGDAGTTVLHHGHCHQKALWGTDPTTALLGRIEGLQCTDLDAGCCGMAGSFGYTRDRYDVSMQVGNLALFPAVLEAPDATILAPGTSCRHQIHDGTQRRALHPAEFLQQCIVR